MFSGIVEKTVKVLKVEKELTNKIFTLENPYSQDIYIDQSISHNGVCLTVTHFDDSSYRVAAIKETLEVSNLDCFEEGDLVNLERCVQANTRMDGHMVQGHVDSIATIKDIKDANGSWEVTIEIPIDKKHLVIHKGSIAINGISLTVMSIEENLVKVAIIPYTYEHTNVKNWEAGGSLNIEFDVIGKYVMAYMERINN